MKRASQLKSQSCEMESSDVFLRAGNKWASSAAFGEAWNAELGCVCGLHGAVIWKFD